jgi:hypothetical protein
MMRTLSFSLLEFNMLSIKRNTIWFSAGILILITTILFLIGYFNLKSLEKEVWVYWETGDVRRGGLVIENSIRDNRRREFVFTKDLLRNPIAHVILQSYPDEVQIESFYLERTGLNSFEVRESIISSTNKYSFEEVLSLASEYDIYKDNPDPKNITSYPNINLTQEEIEKRRENQEQLEKLIAKENREREIATNPQLPEDLETLKGLVEKYYAIAEDETNFLLPNEREEYRQEAERIKQVIDEYEKNWHLGKN